MTDERDSASAAADGLGVIYWLDAAPGEEWPRDLQAIREFGASFVVIGDWFDGADVFRQESDYIQAALDACEQHDLRAYLHIFPAAQMLEPYPVHFIGDGRFSGGYGAYRRSHEKYAGGATHRFVDAFGYVMPFFNLFSRRWREEWLLPYLDTVVDQYGDHPALAGYEFSDLLLLPHLRADAAPIVSYSDEDAERFRHWRREHGKSGSGEPPVLPGRWSADWCDWTAARQEWLVEWARETAGFLRERSSGRAVVLHDRMPQLIHGTPLFGGYTPELVEPFDALVTERYLFPQEIASGRAARLIGDDLAVTESLRPGTLGWRAQCHTRCGDGFLEPATLGQVIETALACGVRRIEIDCYRRPRVPGHIFDLQHTLHEHPEAQQAVREIAERIGRAT